MLYSWNSWRLFHNWGSFFSNDSGLCRDDTQSELTKVWILYFFVYHVSRYLPSDRNFIDPVHLNASDHQGLPGLVKYPFKFTVENEVDRKAVWIIALGMQRPHPGAVQRLCNPLLLPVMPGEEAGKKQMPLAPALIFILCLPLKNKDL